MSTTPRRGRPRKHPLPEDIQAPLFDDAPPSTELARRETRFVAELLPSQVVAQSESVFHAIGEMVTVVDQGGPDLKSKVEALVDEYIRRHGPEGAAIFRRDVNSAFGKPQKLPHRIAQSTGLEFRHLAVAIADAPTLYRWETVLGEFGESVMRHVIEGENIQVRYHSGAAHIAWHLATANEDGLKTGLRNTAVDTILLLYITVGLCILQLEQGQSFVTVSLDDLITALGWSKAARRNAQERNRLRLVIWHWLLMFDGMQVIGARPGVYRDPDTRQILDLTSEDAMLRVLGRRLSPSIRTPDGRPVPLEVTLAPGPWIQKWVGNRQVLTMFGNVCALAQIPSGKAAGSWARMLAILLIQLWRQGASRATIEEEAGQTIVKWGAFTRRQLLTGLLRAQPYVMDILSSDHPQRARDYWRDAVAMLKQAEIIEEVRELEPLAKTRKGWAEAWLDQPLDIIPGKDAMKDAEEIGLQTQEYRARIASKKRRGRKPKTGANDHAT